MSSLDVRTRTATDLHEVDTVVFFDQELPELIAQRAARAVPGARELSVEPFTVATPSGSWTLALAGDTITISPGEDGVAMVRLDDDEVAKIRRPAHADDARVVGPVAHGPRAAR